MKTTFNRLMAGFVVLLYFSFLSSCEEEGSLESCAVLNEKIVEYRSNFIMDPSENNCNLYRETLLDYINNEACPTDSVEIINIQTLLDRMNCN